MINREITVGILAGGRGERMGDFTAQQQKCLLHIDDEPILVHVLNSLEEAFGSVRLIMALSYHAENVTEIVNKNLPKNTTVEYCFDGNKGTRFAYKNILEISSNENILFSSGDAVARSFVYKRLVDKSVKNSNITIGTSTNTSEADTHPLILLEEDRIASYRWPVKNVIPDKDETRDMTLVSGKRTDLLNLIDKYDYQNSILGVFRDAVINNRDISSEIFGNDWLHIAYPNDLQKHWL